MHKILNFATFFCIQIEFQDAFKEIDRLVSLAGHLVSKNHYARHDITHEAQRLERERNVFAGVLAERTRIISLTVKFFSKAEDVRLS